MATNYNYEKALSLEWNGKMHILTIRNELDYTVFNYLYSADGTTWYTSSDLSNSTILTQKNPYNVRWTGSHYDIIGNLSTSSGNSILRSLDGIKYSVINTNLPGPIYDLETNLEYPHTIVFPKNVTLAVGGNIGDTTKIAYSTDEGITWTPSINSSQVFTTTTTNAVWTGKKWIATGIGGNTIGISYDGNTWIGQGSYALTTAGYAVDWSKEQALAVAGGSGTNSLAYSNCGCYWIGLGNTILSTVYDVKWNGTIWVAGGIPVSGNKSLAYSYDGKIWGFPVQTDLFDQYASKISWNGSFWIAGGVSTTNNNSYNLATSSNGIDWKMQKNTNITGTISGIYSSPSLGRTVINSYLQNAILTNSFGSTANTTYRNNITCSSNGVYVTAIAGSNVYVSSNYGVSFTTTVFTGLTILSTAMDSTGQYQMFTTGVSYGNVYVSRNYGSSWTSVLNISTGSSAIIPATSAISSDGTIMVAGGGGTTGTTSYYSTNYGNTWTASPTSAKRVASAIVNGICISAISGSQNCTYHTIAGNTETLINPSSPATSAVNYISSSFNQQKVTVAFGNTQFAYSNDFGVTWTKVNTSQSYYTFYDKDGTTIYVIGNTFIYKYASGIFTQIASFTTDTITSACISYNNIYLLSTTMKIYTIDIA